MKSKLDGVLASGSKPFLMTHLVGGYPTLDISLDVARTMARAGASILEVQVPFSDPAADGPAIVEASHEALRMGATVKDIFHVVRTISAEYETPCVIMSYANPVFRYGIERFVFDAAESGADGIIIPDLPVDTEEGRQFTRAAKQAVIHSILVVSPGVSERRLAEISKETSGFIYATSRQGITGATGVFSSDLPDFVQLIRKVSKIPVAIGFGVKTKEDVAELGKIADIVVAGSVFVNEIKANMSSVSTAIEAKMRELL